MDEALRQIPLYVLMFAIFSMLGWMTEVTLKYIQYHRFINRGFLIGPYCPIYGWGALLITLLTNGVFFRICTPIETFSVGFFVCGALEYIVSWVMEKASHARWWDYSNKPMNLNGRIWIGNLMLFGIAAVAIRYMADPFVFGLLGRIPWETQKICAIVFLMIIWTDRIVSHVLMRVLRDCIDHQQADNTEEIRLEMHKMLRDRSLLVRRLEQAYPELQPRPLRLSAKLKAARSEYRKSNHLLRKLKQRAEDMRKDKEQEIDQTMNIQISNAKDQQKQAHEKLHAIERDVIGS